MKTCLLLLILFLSYTLSVSAQQTPADSAKNIIDLSGTNNKPDTIYLDGSQETSATTQGTMMTISSSTEVGHTPGELTVSASGGATYTVPIKVPPGINGVQPEIALVYNSQGGNGMAGWGWNISGISVITRTPSTQYHDGNINEVNFDNLDRFALDGQRLLLKSGTYGANGAQYETENYSNAKITSHGVSPYGATYGPAYFKVTYPDGSFAYYGNSTNSRSRTDFAITYWQNPQGLRVSYTYVSSGNGLSISSIKYGSRMTTAPLNEIQFTYITRTRAEQAYIGGTGFRRSTILSQINVTGNGEGYRNYTLTYDETSLNYQRLINIEEKSGDNSKSYDPITFNYTNTPNAVGIFPRTGSIPLGNIEQRNAKIVSGEFNGNGKMDFLLYPTIGPDAYDKFWLFTDMQSDDPNGYTFAQPYAPGHFEEIFPVSYLSAISSITNRLPSQQGLVVIQNSGDFQVNFKVYGEVAASTGLVLGSHYTKTWNAPFSIRDIDCGGTHPKVRAIIKYLPGDFNGDGLTDIIAISRPYSNIYCSPVPGCGIYPSANTNVDSNANKTNSKLIPDLKTDSLAPQSVSVRDSSNLMSSQIIDPCCNCQTYSYDYSEAHFINLDKRLTSGYSKSLGHLDLEYAGNDQLLTGDVNGDGKTDILHIKSGKILVYNLDNNGDLQLLWETSDSRIEETFTVLLGDYNGDGKTDFMIPNNEDSSWFTVFLSTGENFNRNQYQYSFNYKKTNFNNEGSVLNGYSLIPVDVNGDGRTDIIDYRTITYTGATGGSQTLSIYVNSAASSTLGYPTFSFWDSAGSSGNLQHFPIPIFLPSDRPNANLDFASMSDKWVTSFTFLKDHREDVLLRSVTNSGITETISYSSLDPEAEWTELQPYISIHEHSYPFVDIDASLTTQVVTKLQRSGSGIIATKQVFSYQSAVSNVEGLGFSGFKRTLKSNWHTNYNNQLFHTIIHEPLLRGAVIKEFTSEDSYISDNIKNAEPNPSNVTLSAPSTGTKTILASQSVTLSPGFLANGADGTFIAKTDVASGINDGATVSDYISRTDYKYETQTKPNKVFINVPTEISTKDQLTGTNTAKHFTYDTYFNSTKEITYFSGEGSKEVNITYANNTGSTYYIGRPTKKITISRNGSDTFSSEEQYTYTGYLPTQIKSKGNNTSFITETRVYDTYGNVTSKTIAPPGETARTTSLDYDPSGRFVTQSTNVDGLTTTYQYNLSTGNPTKEINPYNQSTDYAYDPWGKVTSVTDYLNNTVLTTYQRSGSQDIITETSDDGSSTITTLDMLGRKVTVRSKNVMNQWVEKAFEYDHHDRVTGESQPYTGSAATQWSYTEYDRYGRIKKTTSFTGKITNITYNGLSSTVNDGVKTVTTTKNALGNIIKVTDPGGTINYTYYANGMQKTANYSGVTMSIEQDGWGQKTKLTDPSAGVYTYAYNGFGEIETEITPKGSTTYTYDAAGKILSKDIQGDQTDMQLAYTYNGTTKQLTSLALTNADGNNETYTYTYDTHKRPSSIVESNSQVRFTRNFTYDSYGRVFTENFKAENLATAKESIKKIKNTYQNGQLKTIADDVTGIVVWSVTAVNARGQTTGANLGSAIQQINTYDQYGFPTELKTQKTTGGTLIAKFTSSFNAQRGTLNNRSNSLFSWNENFSYDNLDRLTAFNDPNGNKSQTYDTKGRITNNSALGTYVYSGVSYRQTELNVITAAEPHYQDRPLQQISYNAFKSPVEIIEQGHERISFQYNASMGRAHMYYGGNEVDKMQRRYRKHYSSDGSMEITHDTQTGKTTFVTYIGGDAYSAPAIWREEHTTSSSTEATYYLHRDYLGSILAITDQNGVLKEKRHFDAWGNIVKLTNGSGTTLSAFLILDRGYTGHEHLIGVGLVHMNGRLYDPMLHRFLSPDNYVQDAFNTQNFNRYAYAFNNPLAYVDKDGEFAFLAIVGIAAGIFAVGNTVAHAVKGDIHNFGDALKYFTEGAIVGAAIGVGIATSIGVPILEGTLKIVGIAYGGTQAMSIVSGLGYGIFKGDWSRLANAGKIFLGNFYLDENRTIFGAVLQGISRFTWELPQTIIGGGYSQIRNTFGNVDRVDFFGGATFSVKENSNSRHGLSLGNYINISIWNEINGSFEDWVTNDPLFMHEYGHTFDSQIFGLTYLFAVGLPSAVSAASSKRVPGEPDGVTTHDFRWYEMSANRHAAKYFKKHYNQDWPKYEILYPRKKR